MPKTKPKIIRCSSLPRVLTCPASLNAPQVEIVEDNEAGRLGTAVHELLANLVRGQEEANDVGRCATKYRVDSEQLAPLYYVGKGMWLEYADMLDVQSVEEELTCEIRPGVILLGHPDVVALLEVAEDAEFPTLTIVDFKSGTMAKSHRDQVLGYVESWLANHKLDPIVMKIKTIIFWLRDNIVDVDDVTEADLSDWRIRLNDALDHPKRFCAKPESCNDFCPRQHECPARMQLVQQSSTTFKSGLPASPEALASLYPQAKMLKRALDQYDAALRAAVQANTTLPLGDGRELYMSERICETLDVAQVFHELIVRKIAPWSAMTINKGDLYELISNHAAPQCKGKDNRELIDTLRKKGAIETSTYTALGVRKVRE